MSVLDDIRNRVSEIATERNLPENKAFGYWFLEEIEELSQEEAELVITDGPWDGGRDAVYSDDENQTLHIYQFKYSEDYKYAFSAFSDLQKAIINEENNISQATSVKCHIVTIASADKDIEERRKKTRSQIKSWLKKNRYQVDPVEVEVIDLKKFQQLSDKIFGLDLKISFLVKPIVVGKAVFGLIDARLLKEHVDREELFAFNIRKFLSIRKGSVNWQIKQTLEDESERGQFWMLNNGIVCICTDYKPKPDKNGSTYQLSNFSIVNVAQTINTIAKFLDDNRAIEDPIWVAAKIIKIDESDVERARKLTTTSNTQNPTNNKDLRAVDRLHRQLQRLFDKYFQIKYIYRRGERSPKDAQTISIKEMAQAYCAYWREEPYVSFSRPGKIFADDEYYKAVFPGEEIDGLSREGKESDIKMFLNNRILPYKILMEVRSFLNHKVKDGEDKRMKSMAYHLLWLYKKSLGNYPTDQLLEKCERLIQETVESMYAGISDFLATRQHEIEIPKDLKTDTLSKEFEDKNFFELSHAKTARGKIQRILAHES